MLLSIPWLLMPVIAYFGVAFSASFFVSGKTECIEAFKGELQCMLNGPLFSPIELVSGGEWILTISHLLLVFTLIILFVEILKATRVNSLSLLDHSLSTLLFVACLIMFITVKSAASSTFFLIMVMTLIDVVAGFSITLRSARRDVGFATHAPN